jgi:hypothetical protein
MTGRFEHFDARPGPRTIAAYRDTLRLLMSEALSEVGDTYRAPDGIRYSLIEAPGIEDDDDRLTAVSSAVPVVEEVLRFEDLPVGSLGTRRAAVRWSDGTEGEGLKWYGDEIMVCEGDHGNSRLMSSRV